MTCSYRTERKSWFECSKAPGVRFGFQHDPCPDCDKVAEKDAEAYREMEQAQVHAFIDGTPRKHPDLCQHMEKCLNPKAGCCEAREWLCELHGTVTVKDCRKCDDFVSHEEANQVK